MVQLSFLADPAVFLAEAGEYLASDPVVSTVLASVAERTRLRGRPNSPDDWWLVVRNGDAVVGAAMRTAPFAPHPLYLLPMPDIAAVELARALHARGEEVLAVNGMLPAVQVCADELARLTGREVSVAIHMRLHSARAVVPHQVPEGRLRTARANEVELVQAWFEAFLVDADEQAGRPYGAHAGEVPSIEETLWRIGQAEVWIWEHAGVPVHMSCVNPPAYGVSRLGPVYTPPANRGRGYAGAAVAELTRRALDQGARPILFTDQANPVSNELYARIGYEPVVDAVNLVLS